MRSKVDFSRINAEEDAAMREKFGVNSYPTFIFTDSSQKIYHKSSGAPQSAADFQMEVTQFLAEHGS